MKILHKLLDTGIHNFEYNPAGGIYAVTEYIAAVLGNNNNNNCAKSTPSLQLIIGCPFSFLHRRMLLHTEGHWSQMQTSPSIYP